MYVRENKVEGGGEAEGEVRAQKTRRKTSVFSGKVGKKGGKPDDFTHCRVTYFQFNLPPSIRPDERSNEKPLFSPWTAGESSERREERTVEREEFRCTFEEET